MLTIDLSSPVPLTDQIYAGLRGAIARGELSPGDPLPTVRQLAGDLTISLNTVSRAYQFLERDGLIAAVRGRGTVVVNNQQTKRPRAEVRRQLKQQARDLLANAAIAGWDYRQVASLLKEEARAYARHSPGGA